MSDKVIDDLHVARPHPVGSNGRPIRKDEIELTERGLYVESWMPERRSRRRPLLFIHGELAGSWIWERYLSYFASRGWEGHALNLRNHHWSETTDIASVDFESYVEDVAGVIERIGHNLVAVGHGMGGLLARSCCSTVNFPEICGRRSGRTNCGRSRTSTAATISAGRRSPRGCSATTAT
jgi:pimeloyl-ACP methyl ester carboxylesterase